MSLMHIQTHSNNPYTTIGSAIEDDLSNCNGFTLATAFIDSAMIAVLSNALKCNRHLKVGTLLIGVYANFNRKKDLEELKRLSVKYAFKFKVYISRDANFHLKYYAFTFEREFKCYIGSANFTQRGMNDNRELSISLTGKHPKYTKEITLLKMSFENELKDSAEIDEFPLDKYVEQKRVREDSIRKLQIGLRDFFNRKNSSDRTQPESNKAILILITKDVSARTAKAISNLLPSKDAVEFIICPTRSEVEIYKRHRKILCIDRYPKGVYYITWIEFLNDYYIKTDEGNYIFTYKVLSVEKRMSKKMLEDFEGILNVNLRGRKFITKPKVLSESQYMSAQEIFPLSK